MSEFAVQRKTQISALLLLFGLMVVSFHFIVPHMKIDVVQETWYMGIPYDLIRNHNVNVTANDPFLENGPQAVYPPAAIAYKTGSMKAVRVYQFLFSMAVVALLFFYFFQKFGETSFTPLEVFAYALIFLGTWVSIPMALIYPLQVNGMTGGMVCAILGGWIYPRSSLWGMFFFGLAFAFKGQFLAFFPGLALYVVFIDVEDEKLSKHALRAAGRLAMFFVPKTIVLTLLWWGLGLFPNMREVWLYAMDGPDLLMYEIRSLLQKIAGTSAAMAPASGIRESEYAGYGPITWGHVALSVTFCAGAAAWAALQRFRKGLAGKIAMDRGLAALAWGAAPYWLNFLVFYRYPYWYNTFAIVPFNIFLAAAFIRLVQLKIRQVQGPRIATIFLVVVALASTVFWIRNCRGAKQLGEGNILSFVWMRPR